MVIVDVTPQATAYCRSCGWVSQLKAMRFRSFQPGEALLSPEELTTRMLSEMTAHEASVGRGHIMELHLELETVVQQNSRTDGTIASWLAFWVGRSDEASDSGIGWYPRLPQS